MLDKTRPMFRHDQPGYHALAGIPQRQSVVTIAKSTGWWELDQIWKIYPGQFNVVTGATNSGKSTFILNVVCNTACEHGMKSFLYVPENEAHIREKMGLIWGDRQNWDRFAEVECFVQSAEISHYDQEARTLDWILNKAVIAVKEDGVGHIVLDPWNEIERAKPKDITMGDYIGQCLMWLKQFCRMYSVAVTIVAHPTKAGVSEGKIPSLYDIEGSAHWANKCDNGLIVVRDTDRAGGRVISAKVREIGAGKRGVCYFTVDEETGIFKPQHGAVS